MTERLHYSSKPIERVRGRRKQQIAWKPEGLWYSCGTDWIDWSKAEDFGAASDYVYSLEVDLSSMLVISTPQQLDDFTKEYGVPDPHLAHLDLSSKSDYFHYYIDWPRVSKEFRGIEICPYISSRRMTYMWYYGWDVASGCIWKPAAIKDFTLLNGDESNS